MHIVQARICPSKTPNHYYAIFNEDDVDFEIGIVNTKSDFDIIYDIGVLGKRYGFITGNHLKNRLEALKSGGGKLHFIRQSSEIGETLVSMAASEQNLTFNEASEMISQIKFDIKYLCNLVVYISFKLN